VIVLGVILVSVAVAAGVLATRPRSRVSARLARIAPRGEDPSWLRALVSPRALGQSGLGWSDAQLLAAKAVAALAFATVASAVALLVPIGPAVIAAAGYGGFVGPSILVDRAAARRRRDADAAIVTVVEWAEALVASGRPVESALVAVAQRGVGSALVDDALAAGARAYALGAPLFGALAREAKEVGLPILVQLAGELDRARDLGRGALTVLRDERDRLRSAERARCLDAAGRVEGTLMLILVLCYLPALMLLVVIPLFLGLLDGLFA